MSGDTFKIDRSVILRMMDGDQRAAMQFEEMQRTVGEIGETSGANVDATTALGNASFLTLSANAELDNEFVLEVGEGLRLIASGGVARLFVDAALVPNGHSVRLITSGDTQLALPITGVVATREWIGATVDYADDAAAAAGGVALGEVYRRGDKLAARLT